MFLLILDLKFNYIYNIINDSDYNNIDDTILSNTINLVKQLYVKLDEPYKSYILDIVKIYNKNHTYNEFNLLNLITGTTIEVPLSQFKQNLILNDIHYKNYYKFNCIYLFSLINYALLRKIYNINFNILQCNENFDQLNVHNFAKSYDLITGMATIFDWQVYKTHLTQIDNDNTGIVKLFTGAMFTNLNSAMFFKIFKFAFPDEINIEELILKNQNIHNIVKQMHEHNIKFLSAVSTIDYYVYRAENFTYFDNNVLVNLNIGDTYILPYHSSFSLFYDNDFTRTKFIILRVKLNVASKCIFILNYSHFPNEHEILLSYGTCLKITDKQTYYRTNPDNVIDLIYLIDMEYINLLEFDNINQFFDHYIKLNNDSNIELIYQNVVPLPYRAPNVIEKKYLKYKKLYLNLKYGGKNDIINNFQFNPIPRTSNPLKINTQIESIEPIDSNKLDSFKPIPHARMLHYIYNIQKDEIYSNVKVLPSSDSNTIKLNNLLNKYIIKYNPTLKNFDIFNGVTLSNVQVSEDKTIIDKWTKYITYDVQSNFILNNMEIVEDVCICLDSSTSTLLCNSILNNDVFYIKYDESSIEIIKEYVNTINYLMNN